MCSASAGPPDAGERRVHTTGATHPGRVRPNNEDRWLIFRTERDVVLAVADGVGGQAGGEEAAQLAVDALRGAAPGPEPGEWLLGRVATAQERIRERAEADPDMEGMGTTLTAALVREGRVFWVHVGDSRLYLLRRGAIAQITADHSFVRELVEHGDITPGEARVHPLRNMLDQCLGTPGMRPDSGELALLPGDTLLLCTDGLHGEIPGRRLREILNSGDTPESIASSLLDAALAAGGRDNVTLAIATVS